MADPGAVVARKKRELEQKMQSLIVENPQLLQALERYTEAQLNYKTQREERCADAIIACN